MLTRSLKDPRLVSLSTRPLSTRPPRPHFGSLSTRPPDGEPLAGSDFVSHNFCCSCWLDSRQALRVRQAVDAHNEDDQEGQQEGAEIEDGVATRNLTEEDDNNRHRLTDVLLDGVQELQQVERDQGLGSEGQCHGPGGFVPTEEERVGAANHVGRLRLWLHDGRDKDGSNDTSQGHLGKLRLGGQLDVWIVLQLRVGQDGRVAGYDDLEQDHQATHHRNASAAVVTARVDHHECTDRQRGCHEHVPLELTLALTLQDHHHNGSDQQLRLKQQLVYATLHSAHRQHLKEVAEGVPQTDDKEDSGVAELPALLHALHAVLPVRDKVHVQHGQELAHDGWRVLRVQHLTINLRVVDHHWVQRSRQYKDDKDPHVAPRHGWKIQKRRRRNQNLAQNGDRQLE